VLKGLEVAVVLALVIAEWFLYMIGVILGCIFGSRG